MNRNFPSYHRIRSNKRTRETNHAFEIKKILLAFLLTTVFGSFITFIFQKLEFQNGYNQNLIQTEKTKAQEHFELISHLMDSRLYKMRKIYWAYTDSLSKDEIDLRWKDYTTFLYEWNNNLNRNFALTTRYFGKSKKHDLEAIHSKFRKVGRLLSKVRMSNRMDTVSLNSAKNLMDNFNPSIYFFNVKILNMIEEEKVGIFKVDK